MSDLSLSGETLLVQLINEANPNPPFGPFTTGSFTFGNPSPLSNDLTTKNSSLVVTAKDTSHYLGTQTVKYNRLDIRNVLIGKGSPTPSFQNDAFTLSTDLVDSLNSMFNLALTDADLVSETLPDPDDNGNVNYTVQIHPNSLTYTGTVPVQLTPEAIPLPTAFAMRILNGFVPPDTNRINLASAFTGNVLDGFTVADLIQAPTPI